MKFSFHFLLLLQENNRNSFALIKIQIATRIFVVTIRLRQKNDVLRHAICVLEIAAPASAQLHPEWTNPEEAEFHYRSEEALPLKYLNGYPEIINC